MDNQMLCQFLEDKPAACKVLVVGDIMLDKYYYGEVTRISGEAPVPITRVHSSTENWAAVRILPVTLLCWASGRGFRDLSVTISTVRVW